MRDEDEAGWGSESSLDLPLSLSPHTRGDRSVYPLPPQSLDPELGPYSREPLLQKGRKQEAMDPALGGTRRPLHGAGGGTPGQEPPPQGRLGHRGGGGGQALQAWGQEEVVGMER